MLGHAVTIKVLSRHVFAGLNMIEHVFVLAMSSRRRCVWTRNACIGGAFVVELTLMPDKDGDNYDIKDKNQINVLPCRQ